MDTTWLWTTEGWVEYADIGYSDYSGGTVAKANVATIEALEDVTSTLSHHLARLALSSDKPATAPYYEPWETPEAADVIRYVGGHGTRGVLVKVGGKADHVIGRLSDYPILDEDELSAIESEAEGEAVPGCIRDMLRMAQPDDPDADDLVDPDSDEAHEQLREAMDKANIYFEHTVEGPHLDVKRLLPYWLAEVRS